MEIAILMLDIPVSCSADSHMDGWLDGIFPWFIAS